MILTINDRNYQTPAKPSVAICIDGCDPEYLRDGALFERPGFFAHAEAVVPTFTNPNNVSIITGAPPSKHGIFGNHFWDEKKNADVPMNTRGYLRCPTILETFANAGTRVLSVTSKKKLLAFVSPGTAGRATSAEDHGVDIYSPEASLWVFDQGIEAVEKNTADLIYLSTTDYVQHKHAPGSTEARAFHDAIAARLKKLDALGARFAVTADHGMNAKPNILYLRPVLEQGLGSKSFHLALPITDPYVVHHGALGGCAMIHLDAADRDRARDFLGATPGIDRVLGRVEAAKLFELPEDRIGDLMVLGDKNTALGMSEAEHDLAALGTTTLRSHGSEHERRVPLLTNFPVEWSGPLKNWDLFALLLGA
jgi:phosphonoacetate hydrolase